MGNKSIFSGANSQLISLAGIHFLSDVREPPVSVWKGLDTYTVWYRIERHWDYVPSVVGDR